MTVDVRIMEAIREAVEEAEQPEALARRLIAWFEDVTLGREDINDQAAASRRLEVLFQGTVIEGDEREEED